MNAATHTTTPAYCLQPGDKRAIFLRRAAPPETGEVLRIRFNVRTLDPGDVRQLWDQFTSETFGERLNYAQKPTHLQVDMSMFALAVTFIGGDTDPELGRVYLYRVDSVILRQRISPPAQAETFPAGDKQLLRAAFASRMQEPARGT